MVAVRIPLPARWHHPVGIRRLGAITIALFAALILGVPIPAWLPLAFFGLGAVLLVALAPVQSTTS